MLQADSSLSFRTSDRSWLQEISHEAQSWQGTSSFLPTLAATVVFWIGLIASQTPSGHVPSQLRCDHCSKPKQALTAPQVPKVWLLVGPIVSKAVNRTESGLVLRVLPRTA